MGKHVTIKGDYKSFYAMHKIIPRDKWHYNEPMKFPIVECPNCGDGMLGDFAPHGIKADGTIYNSVVCQNEKCNFHSMVKLEGWNFGEIKRGPK